MNLAILLLAVKLATPNDVVTQFCTKLIELGVGGTLEPKERPALAPLMSKRLLKQADDVRECQEDWGRQQPKDELPNLKPPFVDCCFFSGIPEGGPTDFTIRGVKRQRNGTIEVTVDFAIVNAVLHERLPWTDVYVVILEDGRYVIDDLYRVSGHADERTPLSRLYRNYCRGPKWIGG